MTNHFLGVHRRWETWAWTTIHHARKTRVRTNGPSQDDSQWEVRRNIYQGTVEMLPQEEESIPTLAIICFLSFRQQTQDFHTLLRDRPASISLSWHSLPALLLYESVVCPCKQLSWSGYRLTQESAMFQNDKLLQLVNRMWQCCALWLVMIELLNELFNEQHHHIQLNQPGTPAITEHSNDLHHCILTKQSTYRD